MLFKLKSAGATY
jgi:hypothetical protein